MSEANGWNEMKRVIAEAKLLDHWDRAAKKRAEVDDTTERVPAATLRARERAAKS